MLKLYCQKCGALNAYVSEKPNFCQKCGTGFGGGPNASDLTASTSPPVDTEEDEDEVTSGLGFNLSSLDVDFIPSRPRSETIGNLAKTLEEGGMPLSQEEMPPIPEGEKYTIEDFQREAGNVQRGGNEPEET